MEPTTRIAVQVTFLRADARNPDPRPLPPDVVVVRLDACTVPFYRFLYATVGQRHVWWLRRTLPDEQLAHLLGHPNVSIHVLYAGGEPAGFFELDTSPRPATNLSYFGLLPHMLGRKLGAAFLDTAVETAWRGGAQAVTVNTCTADHPSALPNYLRAGFRKLRTVREIWEVPNRLGLAIPAHLRV